MDDNQQPALPTIEEQALETLLVADRRRRWREREAEKQLEALMEEARGLLDGGTSFEGNTAA